MEHERVVTDERERSGVGRGQNVVYVLPQDAAAIAQFLDPLRERVSPDSGETQLLVLAPDADTAVSVAEAATRAHEQGAPRVVPVTSSARAARLLRSRPASIVAGSPVDILELLRSSALKLDHVRALVIAWADAILDTGAGEPLAAVMAEVPKEAARTIVTSHVTPGVEELIERYARRARRAGMEPAAPAEELALALRYLVVAPQSRRTALRRVLDDLDPERAAVFVRSDDAAREVETTARALGVADGDNAVVLTRGEPVPGATLVVLYELPLSGELLRAVAGSTPAIAFTTPRQLAALRSLAAGARLTPLALSGPAARARSQDERVRSELRAVLDEGIPARELLSLEPLLDEHDGLEIAAAALRLLEHERERTRERPAPERMPMVRLFVSAGTRDDVTPRDLVGAITRSGDVSGSQVGRIELRENHSLVDVAADVAERVVTALTGTEMKGRRIVARVDVERPRSDRGERAGRPEDGARGATRGRFERGDRRERGERFERGERRERGERPRPPRGEGPARPRRPRGE